MNRTELLKIATENHRQREIERACGRIADVQLLVGDVIAQDTRVRKNFSLIAEVVGIDHRLRSGARVTNLVTIAQESEEHRKVTAGILLSENPLHGIITTFYLGYESLDEGYSNSTIAHHEKEAGGYIPHLLKQFNRESMNGDMRRRVAADVMMAENQAKRAEETQAMLWEAMSDPELNSSLAATITLGEIQGPDI